MNPIALYYPHIHVQDDKWLKYAALYWPKMGRLRPSGYQPNDSYTAEVLHDQAQWLIDVEPPMWAATEVGRPFLDLLNDHAETLRNRFGIDELTESMPRRFGTACDPVWDPDNSYDFTARTVEPSGQRLDL